MSRYIENAKEFMGNYKQMRQYLKKKDIVKDSKVLTYKEKLSDNEEIVNEIESWCKKPGSYFLAAPTGSGKSYIFSNIINQFVKNKKDEVVVVSILEPTVVLTEHTATMYSLQSLTGGKMEVDLNKMSACVYDKIEIFLDVQKYCERKGKKIRFIFILDECDNLVSDQFRSVALRKVAKVIETLKSQASIIYTTATFDNCYSLDVEHFLFCNPSKEFSVGKIIEYKQPEGVDFNSFINTVLINKLEKRDGTKFCIRINNKDVIKSIKYKLEKLGFKVASLDSGDKKTRTEIEKYEENGIAKKRVKIIYSNKIYESILHGIFPSDIDVLLVTCLLDEGVSFNHLSR